MPLVFAYFAFNELFEHREREKNTPGNTKLLRNNFEKICPYNEEENKVYIKQSDLLFHLVWNIRNIS